MMLLGIHDYNEPRLAGGSSRSPWSLKSDSPHETYASATRSEFERLSRCGATKPIGIMRDFSPAYIGPACRLLLLLRRCSPTSAISPLMHKGGTFLPKGFSAPKLSCKVALKHLSTPSKTLPFISEKHGTSIYTSVDTSDIT